MAKTLLKTLFLFKIKEKLLLIVSIFGATLACAQVQSVNSKTIDKDFYFKIQVVEPKADTIKLMFSNGGKSGIKLGDQGKIYAVYNEEDAQRSQKELGFFTVTKVVGDAFAADAKMYPSATKADSIKVGDYAYINLDVPVTTFHSIFYDLACYNISFLDLGSKPFYSLNQFFENDSKALEDSLINEGLKDLKVASEIVKKDTVHKVFRQTLTEGRYVGRNLVDIFEKVNKNDLMGFLSYVRAYPASYIAQDRTLTQYFAVYLAENVALNKEEVLDSVRFYDKNPLKLKLFLTKNRKLITVNGYLTGWCYKAYEFSDLGNDAAADETLHLIQKTALSLADTSGLAFYNYFMAQIALDKGQYAKSISYCEKAITLFKQANNYSYYFSTKIKKLYLERVTLDFVGVKKTADELTNDFVLYKSKIKPDEYLDYRGRFLQEFGIALKKNGSYNEAKIELKKSVQDYSAIKNFSGGIEVARSQEVIADIETIQNNYLEAIVVYDSLTTVYNSLNQPRKTANVLNNKGFAYYKMGEYDKSIKTSEDALKIQVSNSDLDDAGYSLSLIGQCLWNLGKLDEAIKFHKQSIEYRKKVNNNNGIGYSFDKLGSLYAEAGEKLKGLSALDSAKFYYRKAKAIDKLASIDGSIGNLYLEDKNNAKAITYFLSAYDAFKGLGLKQEMAEQLYNLGSATFTIQPEESLKYYLQALTLYQAAGVKDKMLYCLLNLGNLETVNKNIAQAEIYFNQALSISKEINGKVELATTYKRLGDAAYAKLNLADALVNYDLALKFYKEIDDKAELSNVNLSLSMVDVENGKLNDSEKHIKESLKIAVDAGNKKGKADSYLVLSDLYRLKGEYVLAKQVIDSCFKIYTELGNSYQIANTHINLGNYYNHLSENIKAIANYKIADSLLIVEKENSARFTTLNNIGTIYFFQNDYTQALVYFNQALKIIENQKIVTEQKILVLSNIGEVYYHKKNYLEAEKFLLQSMKYCEDLKVVRSKAVASLILGKLYYDKGDFIKSSTNLLYSYNYAKTSQEITQLIESSLYLGKLQIAQKKEVEANAYFDEAILYSDRVSDVKYAWDALYQRGLIFYNKNQLDSAERYFKKAIVSVEKSATNIYGGEAAKKLFAGDEKKVSLYSTLISTLIKLGKTDEALEFTSKSNIEAIKEKMGQVGTRTLNVQKSTALDQQKQLAQNVNSVQENLNKEKAKPISEQRTEKIITLQKVQKFAQAQLLNFVDSMVTAYPDLKDNFVKNVNPEELKRYKSKIPPDVAVLLYVVRENQLIIFTLTAETTKAKLINISGAELSADVKDFSTILKYPFKDGNAKPLKLRGVELNNYVESAHTLSETGSKLYKILIEPIKDEILGKTKLCIINNGELSSIPFQTIGNRDDKGVFRYLVEDYSIFYTNRLDIFSNAEPTLIKGLSFAAYGNPDKTLPSAEKEVKEINKIITDATVYIGDVATEDKAKQSLISSRIVHFATHGILDYNDFSKTFLKFATSPGNDGRLTIQDIKGLDIENCDLVTLSACETAVAQDVSKGWFVSPANSLLVSGVKTVVASLWSVDDEATSLLMSSFYENLKTMHKAEALRKAQEILSHNPKYVHPFYWGAFILYGDWR
ncbi:CHAT domain-containing protein [Pedobacter changchengzhani]|uniref:CHAT domain-containing protein n=1 Tax=Pedobacter changchengzhani TaxID=2529274 RepID=A0A4R5MMN5_9SPHI|nr:CHAT domain-containing protein [Pedobacter changchengzhani]TDG36938.1 CHAT domain-containing protein [Pedobacter changchengzhani]